MKSDKRLALDAEQRARAGCITLRRARSTRTIVGLYKSREADMDDDEGELPYTTFCEEHNTLVSHATRKIAEGHLSHPEQWCEDCQEKESS